MTYAEALDLLELGATEAADVQRIRDAYARRRGQLQIQLEAAAAAPVRAAYQETLEAVDVAAAMLQTRAAKPPAASRGATGAPPERKAPPAPQRTVPKTPAPERPDWITATPWHNIQNESRGEFRSADESSAPRAGRPGQEPAGKPAVPHKPAQPRATPAQRPAPTTPPARPPAAAGSQDPGLDRPASVTMRLPDVLVPGPQPPEELRPVVTTLRPRPSAPHVPRRVASHLPADATQDDLPHRSHWGAAAVLLLVIGGAAGVAVWAWYDGALGGLLPEKAPALAERERSTGAGGGTILQSGAGSRGGATEEPPAETGVDVVDLDAEQQLAQRKEEIEQFAEELSRLAQELGGVVAIDWRAQLAAAEGAAAAGDLDQAADDVARLHDTLRAQTDAATRVVTSRQRLRNAGPISGDTATASSAAGHLQSLSRQAELSIAEGNYPAAAQKYERALDARLRLPRDVEAMEPARAVAAAQHARIGAAVKLLDLDEAAAQRIIGDSAGAEALAGKGALVEAWLADERPSSEVVKEYEQLGASFRGIADRLERILELRDTAEASLKELAGVEADIVGAASRPEQLASLLESGSQDAGASAIAGADALRAGRLDDAIEDYEAAATEAAARSTAGARVRDLLLRRAKAAENIAAAAPAAEARLEELRVHLAAKADASAGSSAEAAWREAASRIAADAESLRRLVNAAGGELPNDAAELEAHVRQAELRSEACGALAKAVEGLASAEQRLLLLSELSAGAQVNALPMPVPLPSATEARSLLVQVTDRELSGEDLLAARQRFAGAIEQTDSAAKELAAPAAASLVQMLHARQSSYREQFGAIDLASVWQPQDPLPDVIAPADLAEQVSAAMGAEADADALGRALLTGGVSEAEAMLEHVRMLDRATASLTALRVAAQVEGEDGARPLHKTAAAGEIQQVQALLALGVTPAPRDGQGRTPLGLALAAGHYDVAKLLLESGGKPPGWLEAERPIIFVAAASPEALRLLLEHGAPARDLHRGETALHALAWQANREQAAPARQLQAARILLGADVDATARNRSNQTAAELAGSLGLRELAEFLAKAPSERERK